MTEMTSSTDEILTQFVDNELMEKLGAVLNESHVSIMTVHMTLIYMLAQSATMEARSFSDVAVAMVSMEGFLHQMCSSMYLYKDVKGASH